MTRAVTVILWPQGHPEDTEDTPRMVERAGLLTGIVELLNYSTLVLPIYGLVRNANYQARPTESEALGGARQYVF